MIQLVTDPDRFYRAGGRDGARLGPVTVVALAGIPLVFLDAMLAVQAPDAGIDAVTAMIGSLAEPFVVWVLVAGVFYGLSSVFGGEGGFRRTLRYVGWGFLPSVVSATLVFAAGSTVVTGVASPESAAALRAQLANAPLYRLFDATLTPVFLFWAGFLWTFAVKHARGLDLREAAVTVWVPLGPLLAWMVM